MIASSTYIRFGPRPNAPAGRYRYVTALRYAQALRNGPHPLVTETISADHMFWLPGWLPVGIPRIPTRTTNSYEYLVAFFEANTNSGHQRYIRSVHQYNDGFGFWVRYVVFE